MAFYYKPMSIFQSTLLLSCFASICLISWSEATKNGGITVDLIHRDSPLSPFYDPSHSHFERLKNSFHRSFSRSLNLASFRSTSKSPEAPLTPIPGEYLMKIRIGTPPVDVLAIADTGSDLTWTQCVPCPVCYKQKAPLFDPRKSKTYRNVSCTSQQCQLLKDSDCDHDANVCQYYVGYGDSSYSGGDVAVETFTFDSTSGQNVAFPKVVFGCGQDSDGTFNERTSGIIGLGGGPVSIVRQLERSIGGKFSYCLTSPDSNVTSKISFGSNAVVTGPKVMSTPLVKGAFDTFYYVTLEGLSVGNKKLEYNSIPKSSSRASVEPGNIIIDSGTTLTLLPRLLYEGLESALEKAVNGKRVSDPRGVNGLCYELPNNGEFNSPPIIAHFTGADLVLPQGTTFVEVERGVVCLTLVPSGDFGSVAIFGNLHQRNYLIGFDLENQKVDFLPTDCSNPH